MKCRLFPFIFFTLLVLVPVFPQMMEGDDDKPMAGSEEAEKMMEGEVMDSMMGAGMQRTAPIRSEREYINQMIPHHAEAMDASILVFATSGNGEIRSLSEKIYTAQSREIVDLKLQYAKQFAALPSGDRMTAMMRNLENVSGKARDIRFVEDMIPHHQGAVAMSEEVLALPSISAETKAFAQKVIWDQSEEIKTMQEWLAKNR